MTCEICNKPTTETQRACSASCAAKLAWKARRRPEALSALEAGLKWCARCEKAKNLDDFYNNRAASDGKQALCKECQNTKPELRRRTYVKYKITKEDYDAMFRNQEGRCAICRCLPSEGGGRSTEYLHIDHDEATGQVRGLLCGSCNQGIGRFKHNIEFLLAAVEYLQKAQ